MQGLSVTQPIKEQFSVFQYIAFLYNPQCDKCLYCYLHTVDGSLSSVMCSSFDQFPKLSAWSSTFSSSQTTVKKEVIDGTVRYMCPKYKERSLRRLNIGP